MAVHTESDDQVELGILNANLTQSSNSSLSSSLDSPSTSLEVVGATATNICQVTIPRQWVDSDEEHGVEHEADWSSNVDPEILKTLSDAEKKRQEVINEICVTEKNHVRTLKLLEGIFLRPLQDTNVLGVDHLQLLFPPALITLKDLHSSFESKLKQRRISTPLVSEIGDLLLEMFDGKSGEDLKEFAAHFCARQQIALEALKEKRRKDENLQKILTKAESHKACRRLQLKDLLPTVLQRLTKYPLLFESLFKITNTVAPDNEIEARAIKTALDKSRRILNHVNQAVRVAEDAHKLQTIQKKLDKSAFDKEVSNDYKNLDLTQHKLLHDGLLTFKKNPNMQLHGLLFENMIVLLQKQQDDRYILKYHTNPAVGSNESKDNRFNPIVKINMLLVRQSAIDKNTFFLIINTNVSHMLELTTPSSSECKAWYKHISEASDAYKQRTKGSIIETNDNNGNKDLLETSQGSLNTSNPQIDPNHVLIQNHLEKNLQDDTNTNNNESKKESSEEPETSDEDEKKENETDENEDEEEQTETRERANTNETIVLTQQCSLVEPDQVQIHLSPALVMAEPIVTLSEQLRRLDESIRAKLAEKQRIVCDMFRVPNEHFSSIADIAGQPESPKEPADIVIAAFAQVQLLTETLNEYLTVSTHQEISAVSTSLCNECHKKHNFINSNSLSSTTTASTIREFEKSELPISIDENEDVYCELDELRRNANLEIIASTVAAVVIATNDDEQQQQQQQQIKRQSSVSANSIPEETELEINDLSSKIHEMLTIEVENIDGVDDVNILEKLDLNSCDNNSMINQDPNVLSSSDGGCSKNCLAHISTLVPSVPCYLITGLVTTLNSQITSLMPKLDERETERENLKKENQHLRELLNSLHEHEIINETKKNLNDAEIDSPET